MRKILKFAAAATVAAIGAAALAAPAAAVTASTVEAFASFSPIGNSRNIRWVGTNSNATFYSIASPSANVAGAVNVKFSFGQSPLANLVSDVVAKFTLNGTVSNSDAYVTGLNLNQDYVQGSFSFKSTQDITVGTVTYLAGANLLSGTFDNASIIGRRNSTAAGLTASTPDSSIDYTSDFLSFVPGSNFDFSWSFVSIDPRFNATDSGGLTSGNPNKALRSFRAVVSGQFSADPAPITNAIPEPQAWMLLITGFGLVGVSSRRRRASVAA
jgi:hypothetical protein